MTNISIITDLDTAKEVWQLLSPNQSLYDSWDFRYLFYQHQKFPLHFLTMYEGSKPIGVLPLQYNPGEDCLEFFGGDFMEDNGVYALPERMAEAHELYNAIDRKADLYLIIKNEFTKNFVFSDDTFRTELTGLKNFDDFLEKKFKAHRRSNMRADIRKFNEHHHPKIIKDAENDLDLLFEMNRQRVGNETFLDCPGVVQGIHSILHSPFQSFLLSATCDGILAGGSLSVLYNSTFYALTSGTDITKFPGIGTYLTSLEIDIATSKDAHYYHTGPGDCGWKTRWHLEPTPLYNYFFPSKTVTSDNGRSTTT